MAYDQPNTSWFGERITPAQRSMMDKLVKNGASHREALTCCDKWDAWHYINKYIKEFGNKPEHAPITQTQLDLIKFIEEHLPGAHFPGRHQKTRNEAQEFIDKHYKAAEMAKKEKDTNKGKCLRCLTKRAEYYDENGVYRLEVGGALCGSCYTEVGKQRPKESKPAEPICVHCNEKTAKFYDITGTYQRREDGRANLCLECHRKITFGPADEPKPKVLEESRAIAIGATDVQTLLESGRIIPVSELQPTIKEETNMFKGLNKVFGEFGQDKTGRFALSFFGTAAKVNDTYVTFDGENTTDVMEMIIPGGNDFIFKMPATLDQIETGDIILSNDRVLFVKYIHEDGAITAIDPATNDEIKNLPRKNMFGIQFYTRVTSLMNFGDQSQGFNPMMLLAFQGGAGESKFEELLPFMMMQQGGGNNMQQMLPFLLLSKGGNGNLGQMLPLMMMSQSFGANSTNPFSALFPQKKVERKRPLHPEEDENSL